MKAAQDYLDLEMQRYNTGVDPYVDVVTAQTTLLGNQETLNSLQVEEMISAVQLVQALGGGWDHSQLPYACTSRSDTSPIATTPCSTDLLWLGRRAARRRSEGRQAIVHPLPRLRRPEHRLDHLHVPDGLFERHRHFAVLQNRL